MRSALAIVGAALLASACGQRADLRPAQGQALPQRPALASRTPTPDELLTPPPYAKPQRVDELIRRSEPRRPDRFDLPPPDGGAAPALPAGSDPRPVSNDTGPVPPQ